LSAVDSFPHNHTVPFRAWLDGLIAEFRHHHRAVPLRPRRFLSQIHAVGAVAVGACRLFGSERNAAVLVEQLEVCQTQAREMFREFTRSLTYTYVTPIDAEDMERLARRFLKLLNTLVDAAHALQNFPLPGHDFTDFREKLDGCADSLEEALHAMVQGQPMLNPTRELWNRYRAAYFETRQRRTQALLASMPYEQFLRLDAVYRDLKRILRQFREITSDLREIRLKNS
jgi:uncharacterized protein Yka (UPF0111/DUF47 family)